MSVLRAHRKSFSPTSVQFKGEINDALPRKRHQKRHLEFCNAYLRSRGSGVRISPGAPDSIVFYAYILRSRVTGHSYTGSTSNLLARFLQYNSDECASTKCRGAWDLVHHEEFATLAEAARRERYTSPASWPAAKLILREGTDVELKFAQPSS